MRRITLKALTLAMLGLVSAMCMPTKAFADTKTSWTGTEPSKVSSSETYFLYNVATGQWLGKGGTWGTQAVLADEGLPLTVTYSKSTITFSPNVKAGYGSETKSYIAYANGVNTIYNAGTFYTDRPTNDATYQFTATKSEIGDYYTFKVTSSKGSSTDYQGTFYLCGLPDDDNNNAITGVSDATAYCNWKIVSLTERREAFANTEHGSATQELPATFLAKDYDFSRNMTDVNKWTYKSTWDATTSTSLSNGTTNCHPYNNTPVTYYTYTYTAKGSHEATYSLWATKKRTHEFTAENYTVTTTTPPSEIEKTLTRTVACGGDYYTETTILGISFTYTHSSEDVEVTYTLDESLTTSTTTGTPWYVGNGYGDKFDSDSIDYETNATETSQSGNPQELYGHKWTANIHGASGTIQQTISKSSSNTDNSADVMVRTGWYKVYCKAFTTATEGTGTVKMFAYTGDDTNNAVYADVKRVTDMDPTGEKITYVQGNDKLQDDDYNNFVLIYVGNNTDGDKTSGVKSLTFGITVSDADTQTWTCFDDFAIYYLGDPQFDLILDETQTSVDYIHSQAKKAQTDGTEYKGKRVLYLKRSLNVGKWNSIVLPVNLSVSQINSVFGKGTKVSEFYGANDPERPTTLIFKNIATATDYNEDTAIKAGHLYLINPVNAMPENQTAIGKDVLGGDITDYYTIVNVNVYDADENSMLSDLKASVTTASKGTDKETYGEDATNLKFAGTYVKLTDTLIPANSYVLSGKQTENSTIGLWYYRTAETASKGFRGWLETVDATKANNLTIEINGIEDYVAGDPTGISDIVKNADTVNGNVYNLSGQLIRRNATSLDGLAAGVYVINGKKIVVK